MINNKSLFVTPQETLTFGFFTFQTSNWSFSKKSLLAELQLVTFSKQPAAHLDNVNINI